MLCPTTPVSVEGEAWILGGVEGDSTGPVETSFPSKKVLSCNLEYGGLFKYSMPEQLAGLRLI